MLCAKTLKAAKAALIIILGAWATLSAHAAMNISGGAMHAPAVYANETVSTKGFNDFVATNTTFTITAWSDVTLDAAPTGRYYRFDLSSDDGSAVFGSGIAAASFGTGTDPASLTVADALVRSRPTELVFRVNAAIAASVPDSNAARAAAGGRMATAGTTTHLVLNLNGANPTGPNADNTGVEEKPSQVRAARLQGMGADSRAVYKHRLRLRIYESLADALTAHEGDSTLYDSGATPIVVIDPTLSASIKEIATEDDPLIADVLHNFTKFQMGNAGTMSGDLATVELKLTNTHCVGYTAGECNHTPWPIMPAGADGHGGPVALGDVLDEASLTVRPDHPPVNLKLGAGALMLRDVSGAALKKHEEGDNKGEYIDRSLAVDAHIALTSASAMMLTANVGAKNAAPIMPGSFSATVALSPANGNAASIASVSGGAGVIDTNGTVVHLGYLTGFDGYNQRVIIANRGTVSANYVIGNILTEDGTVATPGAMGSGTVPGESTAVIRVADGDIPGLISFDSGRARAAATLSLTAPTSAISVSTTIVNISDGSTDTSNQMVQ